jgi:hypothetical protein
MGTELFRAEKETDRQTNMTKIIVPFRNFANASKKTYLLLYREIIVVFSDIRTKPIHEFCG